MQRATSMRGWRNTVGSLIEIFLADKQNYRRPRFTDMRVKKRGVRFHRIRDLRQYYFNSILPTFQSRRAATLQGLTLRIRGGTKMSGVGLFVAVPRRGIRKGGSGKNGHF